MFTSEIDTHVKLEWFCHNSVMKYTSQLLKK